MNSLIFAAFVLILGCLYDLDRDFAYNCTKKYPTTYPHFQRAPALAKNLLGYPIASPIGIPACAIMTSNGIGWAAQAGFDILTYKTIRSHPSPGNPFPHIAILKTPDVSGKMIAQPQGTLAQPDAITIANSMGIPSFSLDWSLQDIAKARALLAEGQVLIVSIMGSPSEERTLEEDFALLARAVSDAGAQIVEANLSCPNLHSPLATFKDPVAVSQITKAICEAVPEIPVILKVGLYDSLEQMRAVFRAAKAANAKGICGINAVPMRIVDTEDNLAFGNDRPVAGVSGDYIRSQAYDFIVQARRVIQEEALELVLLATGGIVKPEHFDLFLQAGADVALSATGAMWNPRLAIEFHKGRK